MNGIDAAFQKNRAAGKLTLIPFITVGDPDLDTSVDILRELERAGADIVELGVPYSDPLADGPVIQASSSRALRHKVSIVDCIQVAGRAREQGIGLPFILFTYYNPVLQLGFDRFFRLLAENDIHGAIIPDLPFEENEEVRTLCEANGVHLIPLVAPTSKERIRRITETAQGFIYCVSSLGVTGTRTQFFGGVEEFIADVKRSTDLPVAVGFGISSREQVERFGKVCDGVVVGSAIVRTIGEAEALLADTGTREQGLGRIREFVQELKG
ncbi:tryptophan synthase subunit alpha [Paenibacillus sp. YN15]|uniref:tryptophan synthase subunit alpha n=1 Tax=Paenibacillus sp. YN15 TaxID=1742774 RepID=UPI000DCE446C|nr:tryptophan synthase subunit alpha [Paenibacillus sp. YN15]RAU95569.1 tryptophan synthase subunit alpha [Paenibacillus sp. YN15]